MMLIVPLKDNARLENPASATVTAPSSPSWDRAGVTPS